MKRKIFATEAVVLDSVYLVQMLLASERKKAAEAAEQQRREQRAAELQGSWFHPFRRWQHQEQDDG